MKILLTINKTYRQQIDGGYYNIYLPLQQLGHEVYFYDTVSPEEKDYNKVIESFKPDLIYCCMTGNKSIAPFEPWEQIKKETDSGRTKTFNWFADDDWRFDNFSKHACHSCNVCPSNDEFSIDKFKEIGYSNIFIGDWHTNYDLFPKRAYEEKDIDLSFVGSLNPTRKSLIDYCESKGLEITKIFGVPHSELLDSFTRSKVGINVSTNDNHPQKITQVKLRIFEVTAGMGLLMTSYHKGIERYFDIDKEIISFKTSEEFVQKYNFLKTRPKLIKQIALKGHNRFLKDHESKVRLPRVLKEIEKF